MKNVINISAVALLCGLGFSSVRGQELAARKERLPASFLSGEETRAAKLYRQVLPTVVTIFTSRQVLTPQGPQEQRSLGTGVLISPENHVLTAAHVVDAADTIIVKTQDGSLQPAEILYSESNADIALVKLVTPIQELKHAKLGDSDRLVVGQAVYVIGAPYGLENSFSTGHVTGFRELSQLSDGAILAEYIQTDAAINSGNSGGPVFDSQGEVIGIASRILTESGGFQGLGFVVAINTAKQLLALEDRPWMGIDGVFLNAETLTQVFNINVEGGLLVQHVAKGSPADKAGLRGGAVPAQILGQDILLSGDLIVEFSTQEACDGECLAGEGQRFAGLNQIPVKFLRGGKMMQAVIDVSATRRNFLH